MLSHRMGLNTFEDWVDNAPKLSLLTQGWLDRPSAPLLLINGTDDTVFSPDDMQLLLFYRNRSMHCRDYGIK